jgi:uncharacterized membrane protein
MMAATQRPWNDRRFEVMLGNILRAGVVLSGVIVLTGGFMYVIRHGGEIADYGLFRGEPAALRSVRGIVTEALSFSGRGLIQFGLLLLIATPIARVVFSIVGFLRQRDWLYVAITLIVLVLLGYSLLGGLT